MGAVAANGFSISAVAPTFLLAVAGSVVAGPALSWIAAEPRALSYTEESRCGEVAERLKAAVC